VDGHPPYLMEGDLTVPGRTIDPVKRRASTNRRKIRFRARQKEKKVAAIAEAKRLHREALDAARVARGLLPLKLAKAASLAKFREKQKLLRELVKNSWFGPSLTNDEFDQYAKEQGWDVSVAESRWASFNRVAAVCEVNVNRYLLRHYGQGAEDARLRFHESWLQTQDIGKALEFAKTIKVQFVGRNAVSVELNRQARYEAARERWSAGSEIVAALLGKSAV
jgi:hypothetical protein